VVIALGAVGAAGLLALAWGWFEAGWVRLRVLEVEIAGLPPELDGLRIVHLSDFHLGVPSRGARAVERGVEWAASRGADLVAVTGDNLTRPSGLPALRRLLARVPGALLVLGNHDIGVAKDPLVKRAAPYDAAPGVLLRDEACVLDVRGRRVQVVGLDPASVLSKEARPGAFADLGADLRILLCHFPDVVDDIAPGMFHVVLAGHLHDGQIAVPYGLGKLRLGDPRARYAAGLYRAGGMVLHVSPGLGTTFVPFRFFARPEATELVLTRLAGAPDT